MMENIKINLDNEEFIKKAMPLLKDLEERDYDLRKQHNSNFLIFVGFIITTAGVIISLNDVTLRTKYILISSIICYTLGYFCSFSHSSLQIQKFGKTIKGLLNWSNIDSMERMREEANKINNVWKETKGEKFFKICYIIFQNLGIILFIIGLIMFISFLH